jgi:hypothetical protein
VRAHEQERGARHFGICAPACRHNTSWTAYPPISCHAGPSHPSRSLAQETSMCIVMKLMRLSHCLNQQQKVLRKFCIYAPCSILAMFTAAQQPSLHARMAACLRLKVQSRTQEAGCCRPIRSAGLEPGHGHGGPDVRAGAPQSRHSWFEIELISAAHAASGVPQHGLSPCRSGPDLSARCEGLRPAHLPAACGPGASRTPLLQS